MSTGAEGQGESPCRCIALDDGGIDATACRAYAHRDFLPDDPIHPCPSCGKPLRLTTKGTFPAHVPANGDRDGSGTRCTSVGTTPARERS